MVDIPLVLPYSPDSIQVSIVWNDPAALPLATVTLINDLDIELIAPDFTVHQAWVLDPDTPEAAATRGANILDVIEQVRVSNPVKGTWTIRVTGTDVPSGPQPFAIAYRGAVGPCAGDRLRVAVSDRRVSLASWEMEKLKKRDFKDAVNAEQDGSD